MPHRRSDSLVSRFQEHSVVCRRSRSSSTSSPHVRHAVPSARSQHRTRAPGSQVACRARRPTGARQVDRDRCVPSQGKACDPPTPAGARGPRCGFVLIRRAYLVLIMSSTGDRITLSLTLARLAGLRAPLPADNPLRRPRAPLRTACDRITTQSSVPPYSTNALQEL